MTFGRMCRIQPEQTDNLTTTKPVSNAIIKKNPKNYSLSSTPVVFLALAFLSEHSLLFAQNIKGFSGCCD